MDRVEIGAEIFVGIAEHTQLARQAVGHQAGIDHAAELVRRFGRDRLSAEAENDLRRIGRIVEAFVEKALVIADAGRDLGAEQVFDRRQFEFARGQARIEARTLGEVLRRFPALEGQGGGVVVAFARGHDLAEAVDAAAETDQGIVDGALSPPIFEGGVGMDVVGLAHGLDIAGRRRQRIRVGIGFDIAGIVARAGNEHQRHIEGDLASGGIRGEDGEQHVAERRIHQLRPEGLVILVRIVLVVRHIEARRRCGGLQVRRLLGGDLDRAEREIAGIVALLVAGIGLHPFAHDDVVFLHKAGDATAFRLSGEFAL